MNTQTNSEWLELIENHPSFEARAKMIDMLINMRVAQALGRPEYPDLRDHLAKMCGPAKNKVPFRAAWDLYDKKTGRVDVLERKWNLLSALTQAKAIEHMKKYVAATPDKQFRMGFNRYLNEKAWNNEIIASGADVTPQKPADYDQFKQQFQKR